MLSAGLYGARRLPSCHDAHLPSDRYIQLESRAGACREPAPRLGGRRARLGAGCRRCAATPCERAGQTPRRRRRRRSRVRRADRGPRALSARAIPSPCVEARDRVGGRVLNAEIRGRDHRARRHVRRPDRGPPAGPRREAQGRRSSRPTTPARTSTSPTAQRAFADTSPPARRPPTPRILPDLALIVTDLDEKSTTVPVDAPWEAANAAEWDAQMLDSTSSERDQPRVQGPGAAAVFRCGQPPRCLDVHALLRAVGAGDDVGDHRDDAEARQPEGKQRREPTANSLTSPRT